MDLAAIWPIIQRVLVNLLGSLFEGKRQVITIENINATIATEIKVCGNNAIIRSFDPDQLREFLREFLSTVGFLQLKLDQISLRLDRHDAEFMRTASSHSKRLEALDAKLEEIASEKVRMRPKGTLGGERARRRAADLFREVEEKIARGAE